MSQLNSSGKYIKLATVLIFSVFLTLLVASTSFSQSLQKLEFKEVKDAPTLIEREKAVLYIRSTVPNIFVNSTNPNYTFRKVRGKEGEWVLRINPWKHSIKTYRGCH